jgi:hypothetical protein
MDTEQQKADTVFSDLFSKSEKIKQTPKQASEHTLEHTEIEDINSFAASLFSQATDVKEAPTPPAVSKETQTEGEAIFASVLSDSIKEKQKEARQRSWVAAEENRKTRRGVIWGSIIASVIPPMVLLLLGYGVAWVWRGFGVNK